MLLPMVIAPAAAKGLLMNSVWPGLRRISGLPLSGAQACSTRPKPKPR